MTHFKYKDPSGLMWKGLQDILCRVPLQNNIAEVIMLLSYNIDFKAKIVQ